MCRMIGFVMFWVAVGMLVSIFIENLFINICLVLLFLILGFNFFCK